MTDLSADALQPALRRVEFQTDEAKARLRARYRSEARFKFYGIAALAVTIAFLFALLTSIVSRGLPGFFQNVIVTDVFVDPAKVDPDGKRDAATLRAGDYTALARATLAAAVPGIEGRQQKKELNGLLSSGAGDMLRQQVVADPSLVGQRVSTRLLLSDEADVFLKRAGSQIRTLADTRGVATPSGVKGDITISVGVNDFADDLTVVKAELKARADAILETVARRRERGAVAESLVDLEKEASRSEVAVRGSCIAGDTRREDGKPARCDQRGCRQGEGTWSVVRQRRGDPPADV